MYKYKTINNDNVIEVTSLKKFERIDIFLRDKNIHSGSLRLVIADDNSVIIHKMKQVKVSENINLENSIGVDKGYVSLFVVNSGRSYGENLNKFLNIETERLNLVNARRNRIWTLMKKYTDDGDLEKAGRIYKNNFGKIKYNNQKRKFDTTVKSYINHEIKIMLDTEKPTELILEKLDFQSFIKKFPKHIKRKLSRWIKGYIQERLEYKASLRQVKITIVNPAYTSQVCHSCGSFGNRTNKIFICKLCGTMDADYNAACNIKDRKYDLDIDIYTSYKRVKAILSNRNKIA